MGEKSSIPENGEGGSNPDNILKFSVRLVERFKGRKLQENPGNNKGIQERESD